MISKLAALRSHDWDQCYAHTQGELHHLQSRKVFHRQTMSSISPDPQLAKQHQLKPTGPHLNDNLVSEDRDRSPTKIFTHFPEKVLLVNIMNFLLTKA